MISMFLDKNSSLEKQKCEYVRSRTSFLPKLKQEYITLQKVESQKTLESGLWCKLGDSELLRSPYDWNSIAI